MLVAVRKHPIEFEIRGVIPEKLISGLRKEYGEANVRVERDDMVNAMEMEWFKDLESEDTPGKNLRFYRKLIGMTQPELAKKLGTSKQFISDMENGRKRRCGQKLGPRNKGKMNRCTHWKRELKQ